MSDLKTLICVTLLTFTVSSASADHRSPGSQGPGCNSGGNTQMSGGYGVNRLGYAPQGNYGAQGNYGGTLPQWNGGYIGARRFNGGQYSSGYNGESNYQDQYRGRSSYGYGMNDRQTAWGRDSYVYGSQNLSRGASGLYDNVHRDHHTHSLSGARNGTEHHRVGSQVPFHIQGASLNFGW